MGGKTSAAPGGAKRGPDFVNPNEAIEDGDERPDTELLMSLVLQAVGALRAYGNENLQVGGLVDALEDELPTLRGLIVVGDMHRADLVNWLEAHPS